jgi:hypothetical protein
MSGVGQTAIIAPPTIERAQYFQLSFIMET